MKALLTVERVLILMLLLVSVPRLDAGGNRILGRIVDQKESPVAAAAIIVRDDSGASFTAESGRDGRFSVERPSGNGIALDVIHPAFASKHLSLDAAALPELLTIAVESIVFREDLVVTASRIAAEPRAIPGGVEVLDRRDLESDRVFNTSEALRKVAGVNVRDEEGFGLRPNIGIRGLNPTRSSKVLLLEDGVPLAYAPYGDNATYYHPPIERYESVEVLKGSGQIAHGPSTVGGVINYVTPEPPAKPTLRLNLANGTRGYSNGEIGVGASWGRLGGLLNFMRKEGDGARQNTHSLLNDSFGKITYAATPRHHLSLRGSYYDEDSTVTYSGLRQAEYEADSRQNPFENDSFQGSRSGVALTHTAQLSKDFGLTTTAYRADFERDWWRQSSNSAQRPNDSADPNCGGMDNLGTTCGNEGRLRRYVHWGVESRARMESRLRSVAADTVVGIRFHSEDQERRQVNGDTPLARAGRLVENNERSNQALAGFVQTHLSAERWTLSPGLRIERIRFARTNRLAGNGTGVSGEAELTEVIPGLGLSYAASENTTVFAGVHRGFAPPRTEDVISNATGQVVDLDAERSWNSEIGLRSNARPGLQLSGALFRMQYENQVIPATVAGGVGATLTNGGRTLHQGLEISARIDTAALFGWRRNFFTKIAHTWLPTAEYAGTRFSSIAGSSKISVSGNRLPYAPEQLLTGGIGYLLPSGSQMYIEAVHLGEQFGDDLNTVAPSADGQRGLIPASTVLNAALNVEVPLLNSTFFVVLKNATNLNYIVDRSRGILPGSPRLIQAGVTFRY